MQKFSDNNMSLFQNNIISKYSKTLDNVEVSKAFENYRKYFLNAEIQENIRHSKEEQFQEGFLRELFVNVLGYTLNPLPSFNLITEKKNAANSKKADGAILVNNDVVGIIELKDGKTTDLGKVEEQAFNYKSQHKSAVYVIISNFEKLRFYIDNAVEYQEFNLFNLNENEFKLLYICLAFKSIEASIPKRIKEESLSNEDIVTKNLYRDYSVFKRELFDDILKNNPCDDAETKIMLFKKTQKLLDRLLFIFFAEDSGLLMPNTMIRIISDWEKLKDLDAYTPLYNRIKKYFGWLNDGYKGKDFEVFAYNGGLFKPDEILDNLIINDEILKINSRKLSDYDYASDVDVNILGHIFENSLNEIEEVTNQLQNNGQLSTSKRKKDGVFYTPQYITKYIVENTVGKLCAEKKQQLGIVEEEYFSDKRRQATTKRSLIEKLDAYREWLLGITICDPACGSGAFLNAALQFLMSEHKLIDEMQAKVTGESIIFPNVENAILENNLFGVDINEESAEIAKLSLWLRTAQPHRKLSSLNENIKCGNSLISNPEIAGSKAFDWKAEFPKVFENGGFDVVIGNPPYVHLENIVDVSQSLEKCNYLTFNKRGDLYCLFVEKAFNIAKESAYISYIMPNKWMQAGYGYELRKFFLTKRVKQIIDFGDLQIFEGATTYPCIFVAQNDEPSENINISVLDKICSNDFNQNVLQNVELFDFSDFSTESWVISSKKEKLLLDKLNSNNKKLSEVIDNAYRGVLSGLSEAFLISKDVYDRLVDEDINSKDIIHPFIQGRDIQPYNTPVVSNYLILFEKGYTKSRWNVQSEEEGWNYIFQSYPAIAKWLEPFAEKGRKRTDKGDFWWELRACDYYDRFENNKIIYQVFQVKPCFVFDDKGLFCNNSVWFIPSNDKGLLAVLNSKIGWWLITKSCSKIQSGYQLIWKYFSNIPIPDLTNAANLSEKSDLMISLSRELQEKRERFLRRLRENFSNIKINSALESFDDNDFAGFVAELKKQKIKLSLVQQDEWEEYFVKYKTECNAISEKNHINGSRNQQDGLRALRTY